MALLQVSFFSKSLMRTVPVTVVLPVDKIFFLGMPVREEKPFKTLYLLHGIFGNHTDWVSGTNIQRWAEEKDLAVVMPSGENSFYVDNPGEGRDFGRFTGEELVEVTRKMFPLSRRREDTYIAGLSMGGYGAIRNGLKYHETFGCIAGLSAALITDSLDQRQDDGNFLNSRTYAEGCFGDLAKVAESDMNPKWLVKKLKEQDVKFPAIYLACGESDTLLGVNEELNACLEKAGVPATYEVGPGAHEWDFWNRHIKKVLDWLPLEGGNAGLSSGNVGV